MSGLEARIAEVLADHWSASTHTDSEPFVDKCDGCGAVVRTWGEQHGTGKDGPLVSHQAAMLTPVIMEAQEEAFDEGVHETDRMTGDSISDAVLDTAKMNNPYRSNHEHRD